MIPGAVRERGHATRAGVRVVDDLSGTEVTEVNVNLAAFGGAGDAAADTVVAVGTSGDDVPLGNAGDDVLIGGPGLDVLDRGEGDDIEIQG